jgi:hypothetical protein
MVAKASAVMLRLISEKIKMALLTINPMRAANVLGPAFTSFFFVDISLTILRDTKPIGLYFERSALRIRKSNAKKAGMYHSWVNIKSVISKKVKSPFSLATRSSILLLEIGHAAYVFIACLN